MLSLNKVLDLNRRRVVFQVGLILNAGIRDACKAAVWRQQKL